MSNRQAHLSVNDRLEIKILSFGGPSGQMKSCSMRLSRVLAQRLGDALLDFAGNSSKGYGARSFICPGDDLDPVPPPIPSKVVRLGSGTRRLPVVKLRR